MDVFKAVKTHVRARAVAEWQGLQVQRNGFALCPFHDDHHPSLKLDDRYHCFGCGADGDAVDLLSALQGGRNLRACAVEIAEAFDIPYDNTPSYRQRPGPITAGDARIRRPKPENPATKRAAALHQTRRDLQHHLTKLRERKETYAPKDADQIWHPYFTEALENEKKILYLLQILDEGTEEEQDALIEDRKEKKNWNKDI